MHILRTNFNGNPNIGLFGIANDGYCIIGSDINHKLVKKIKEVLKVPVVQTDICGTGLVGAFCAANSNCLLLPNIVFESELKMLDKYKIKYEIIDTKHTALGNNVLCNDEGCIVSKKFKDSEIKRIEKALGIKAVKGTINKLDVVGSLGVLNKKGCLVHEDVTSEEIKVIEKLLKVRCGTGTVNLGSPFIKSGIIANSNGFLVSINSGGPEIANADEVLGFIE